MTTDGSRGRFIAAAFAVALVALAAPFGAAAERNTGFMGGGPLAGPGLVPVRDTVLAPGLGGFEVCELDKKTGEVLGECFPAVVPGDIFTSLMEAGRVEDPYRDANSKDVQWVDGRDWLYRAEFEYKPAPGRRLRVVFMGLDYFSEVALNGSTLAEHEGMFSRVDLDLTDYLDPSGRQVLAVKLLGIPEKKSDVIGNAIFKGMADRKNYLKTQMNFDWDFAPRLKGVAVYDQVALYETGPARITDLFLRGDSRGNFTATVETTAASGEGPAEAVIELDIGGIGFGGGIGTIRRKVVIDGDAKTSIAGSVPGARLWWPWDMGEQSLYLAEARLIVSGEESDAARESFGFRDIEWGENPDAPPGSAPWVLYVNGKREFMRGVNMVPPETMYGRMTPERYEKLVAMTREMGANMVRMWGGGNREWRSFYDYCDRAGLLVWQEFPFACVYILGYPRTAAYKALVRQETEEITRQLRSHPSLFMWCGGNEFNVKMNGHVVKIMEETAARLDPTRRFIPGSPYKGDTHNWIVWHMQGNLSDYFSDVSPMPSEFGLQAYPDYETFARWISGEHHWPINDMHVHHDLGPAKMDKYVSAAGPGDGFEAYIEASQLVQAHYLQRGIENWRQRKYKTSGAAFWQLNEPWPAICWSVIDYDLRPKLAYEVLRNTYNPVLVTARFDDRAWKSGDMFRAEVMVVNDLHEHFESARVSAEICGEDAGSWTVDVGHDEVVPAGYVEMEIPKGCERPTLKLGMVHGGSAVAGNEYQVWLHDPVPASKLDTGMKRTGMWIMTGAWEPKPEK